MLLDIVITSDMKLMFCSCEECIYKWDFQEKKLLGKIPGPRSFIYLTISSDDSKIYSNCYGASVYVIDT